MSVTPPPLKYCRILYVSTLGEELPVDRTQALTAPTEKEDLPTKDEAPLATRDVQRE